MNNLIHGLHKDTVTVIISGNKIVNGSLLEIGSDLIVLFDGIDFMYITLEHIHEITRMETDEENLQVPTEFPGLLENGANNHLALTQILSRAIGMYCEINVTNKQPLHGKVLAVMGDYFVFYSPIYKTMYIAMKHLKWLIPYIDDHSPYGIVEEEHLVKLNPSLLATTFALQIEKLKNKLVMFNLGEKPSHFGTIKNSKGNIIELQTAGKNVVYVNLSHIKMVNQV